MRQSEAPGQLRSRISPQKGGGAKRPLPQAGAAPGGAEVPAAPMGNWEIGTRSRNETLIGYFGTTGS